MSQSISSELIIATKSLLFDINLQVFLIILQDSFAAAKKSSRKKNHDEGELSGQLKAAQVSSLKLENVWELTAVHGFLDAICR